MAIYTEAEKHTFKSPKISDILRDAVQFFNTTPALKFPPPLVPGAGVYAIYYVGKFPLYQKFAQINATEMLVPIYVGKAVSPGWRTARTVTAEGSVTGRLGEHARSIKQTNLSIDDFRCRL